MNPVRVILTEYSPGRSLWPTKIPFSSVNSSIARPPANSGVSQTLAPMCGFPAGSTTSPVSLPKLCAARSDAVVRKRPERTKAAVLSDFTDSPHGRSLRRDLLVGWRRHRKVRRPADALIGHGIGGLNLDSIFAGRQRLGRHRFLYRHLLTRLV